MKTQELINATEELTGKNTVKFACTTGFIMVEMISNELAQQVAKIWEQANKMEITLKDNKVYAF